MIKKIILNAKLLYCKFAFNPLFIIKIEDGIVTKVSGTVKSTFMNDCLEIAERNQLQFGLVYAVNSSYGKAILKASGEVPGTSLQQLRNTWGFNS